MGETTTIEYGPSKLGMVIGGVCFLGLFGTIGIGLYLNTKEEVAKIELEKARIENGYVIQERDLNGNGVPEKFYNIDSKIAVVELDGKPLFSSIDSRVLEKVK